MAEKEVLILGIGNILLKDDGIGVYIVDELKKRNLPEKVELFDGGTGGFHLIPFIEGKKKLIIIDAIVTEDEPGTIYRLNLDDVVYRKKAGFSLHEAGIIEALRSASLSGAIPEAIVIGIRPKDFKSFGTEITPEVKAAFPRVIELVMKEVSAC